MALVNWMFTRFLETKSETVIADELNRKAIPTSTGRRWTRYSVTRVLKNENYIGNLVYNRRSKKLNSRLVPNPPELWVRTKGCIEPIVELDTFVEANKIISARRVDLLTEDEMLARTTVLPDGTTEIFCFYELLPAKTLRLSRESLQPMAASTSS